MEGPSGFRGTEAKRGGLGYQKKKGCGARYTEVDGGCQYNKSTTEGWSKPRYAPAYGF